MKSSCLVLSVLLFSVLYSLLLGNSDQVSKTVTCKSDLFKSEQEKKYSYIYSSAFLGCKQKEDKEHFAYLASFYNTSTGHLLCIAGLHIASLTLLIFLSVNLILYVFFPAFRKKGIPYFWISLPIGIITSVLYVCFIGPEIPRLRAIIMLLLGLVSLFIPVFKNKLLILAITASIILFFMPDSIYTYSFYYSFVAVLGIFLSSTRKTICVCCAIYLFLLPLNLHSSGTFDVNNVLANFVVIPFFCFIYYPINIVLMLLFFSGVHSVIYLMNISTDVLLYLLRFFSWISRFTKIKTFNANTTEVIILYTVLLLFFFGIKYSKHFNVRKIIYFYIAVTAISITTVLYFSFFEYKQKNELIIFDLQKPKRIAGSGDILFISNGSKNIIVDTGFGKFSSQKVISKIKRRKVDIIDYLIITHSDFDHIGGMKDFLSEFYVRNIIISRAEYYYFLQNGLMNKTNVVLACDGINLELDRASSIRFFHPNCKQEHKNTYKYKKENNETVLSFFVSLADYKFMINSDLPKKHLEEILRNNKREAPNLVCQMPHHCNKKDNPSELLNSSKPILGFCTRDRTLLEKSKLFSNDFTFPIFMTGVCGDIDIRVENSGLAVFSEKCSKLSLQLKGS